MNTTFTLLWDIGLGEKSIHFVFSADNENKTIETDVYFNGATTVTYHSTCPQPLEEWTDDAESIQNTLMAVVVGEIRDIYSLPTFDEIDPAITTVTNVLAKAIDNLGIDKLPWALPELPLEGEYFGNAEDEEDSEVTNEHNDDPSDETVEALTTVGEMHVQLGNTNLLDLFLHFGDYGWILEGIVSMNSPDTHFYEFQRELGGNYHQVLMHGNHSTMLADIGKELRSQCAGRGYPEDERIVDKVCSIVSGFMWSHNLIAQEDRFKSMTLPDGCGQRSIFSEGDIAGQYGL